MSKGTVFNIQKFSINDGPGIRTTVFMKGCPLDCLWCHNPESKSTKPEIFFDDSKCIGCRGCEAVCNYNCHTFTENLHTYNRADCTSCGKCSETCVTEALETAGKLMNAEDVIAEVLKDKAFYDNSGGGMTLSGGEPMAQFDFTLELLKLAKENGLHTCMETCGYARKEDFIKVIPYVDIFLFDYKETNPIKHKEFTRVSNELILSNLKLLDNLDKKIILRCPIIPTLNDRKDHFKGIADEANSLKNILEKNIEPYHPLGKGKAEKLCKDYPLADLTFPEEDKIKEWIDYIAKKTSVPVKKA